MGKIAGERTCLIFDLGGSTLDIAVVAYKDKHIKIIKIVGDPNLGGEDFDIAFVEYCLEEFKKKHQIDLRRPQCFLTIIESEKVARNLRRLKMECEKQKCFLSSEKRVVVRLDKIHGELDLVVPITRETFEKLNESKFQRCLTLVKQTMEECGLRKEAMNDIVLVGGSTRIPRVQQLLKDYFGKRLSKNFNADEAVAFGAAMQAHFVNSKSKVAATFNPVIVHLDFPVTEPLRDELQLQPKPEERTNLFEEVVELLRKLTEVQACHHRQMEKMWEDFSVEREERSKVSSSVTDLEGKMEMLLNHLENEISIKNIRSFQNTARFAVAVVLKNSTSTRFLHPNKWFDCESAREYFPMSPEILPFSKHGFGFTNRYAVWGLFGFQIRETRFVALCGACCGYIYLGLAFLPLYFRLDQNLSDEIRVGADWSNSREKCKVYVTHEHRDGQIEAHLKFGSICAEATMTAGEKSVLNIKIKTIPK